MKSSYQIKPLVEVTNMKKELGYGMALAGVLAGAGALAVAFMRKKSIMKQS